MQSKLSTLTESGAAKLKEISEKEGVYTDFLKFTGRVFKQDSSVALEFFAQNSTIGYIATARQWNAANYKIKGGSEAIRFTDENGNVSELYDFSQVTGDTPPKVWTINKENVVQIKSAFGVPENSGLVATITNQAVTNSQIAEHMRTLNVPPNEFAMFRKCYIGAVQTIIAGRFEIGGSKFDVNPDSSVFRKLGSEDLQIEFLTMVSNTSRELLLKIEKIILENQETC